MLRIITEEDAEFRELQKITEKAETGFDYTKLAREIEYINNNSKEGLPTEKIVITFPHTSISNLVYGLKRRNLTKDVDYKTFKLVKRNAKNKQQILVQPLGQSKNTPHSKPQ